MQTADMLNLPVPEAEYINEVLKPSETQEEMVSSFADRAEAVRNGNVNPRFDNMLKITNDGRKLALDQRLINDMLPDEPESKVNRCVDNAFKVWEESAPDKGTQLIFCDLSTPKTDGTFNVYDDVRKKLVARGVPREEVAFMRNEQRKDAVSPIVVDSKGVFVTDAPNGFENVRSILTEYVHRDKKKQPNMTEHEKCLTNGTYERARESGTEQNYDMIDGCVNNVPKKPRRIGGRWSVLDRLHIKQAERKQKEQPQQQQQERSRKN